MSAALLFCASPITVAGTISIVASTGAPQIDINDDGTITYTSNGVAGIYYSRGWYQAASEANPVAGAGSRFEARLTADPGTFTLELLNTWVDLDTGTSWSRSSLDGTSTGLLEFRDAVTGAVVGSCTLTLQSV
jgi:hypothetical protein